MRLRIGILALLIAGSSTKSVADAPAITVSMLGECTCPSEFDFGTWHPAWSPDGASLAYATGNAYPPLYLYWGAIVVTPLQEATDACIYGDHTFNGFPSWAPDSRRIVFAGDASLRILDCDSTERPEILWAGSAQHPAWSPDGSTIAFESSGRIWLVPATGGAASPLTMDEGRSPSWSPDGTRIAYQAAGGIWIVAVTGREPRRLVEGSDPAWSPDGKWIAFASTRDGNSDIWVISERGGTAVRVTDSPADESDPAWSPDQRSLVYSSASADGACSCTFIASDLPADWTISVTPTHWGRVKSLYR